MSGSDIAWEWVQGYHSYEFYEEVGRLDSNYVPQTRKPKQSNNCNALSETHGLHQRCIIPARAPYPLLFPLFLFSRTYLLLLLATRKVCSDATTNGAARTHTPPRLRSKRDLRAQK
eukprot:3203719-Rhodomonas_salina.1